MVTTKTVEELEKEAKVAAQALEAAKEAQRQEERRLNAVKVEAERKAKIVAEWERWKPRAEDLVKALRAAGFSDAKWAYPESTYDAFPNIYVNRPDGGSPMRICFDTRYSGSGFHSRLSGYKVRVGGHGADGKSFPMNAQGSFNYKRIAEELKSRVEQELAERKRRAAVEAAAADGDSAANSVRRAARLPKDTTLVQGSYTRGHYEIPGRKWRETRYTAAKGKVFLTVHKECTPEQALVVIEAMRTTGLLETK